MAAKSVTPRRWIHWKIWRAWKRRMPERFERLLELGQVELRDVVARLGRHGAPVAAMRADRSIVLRSRPARLFGGSRLELRDTGARDIIPFPICSCNSFCSNHLRRHGARRGGTVGDDDFYTANGRHAKSWTTASVSSPKRCRKSAR